MFENVKRLPGDPILGLIALFNNDKNPHKIDLGPGVYRDPQGHTPILDCVKKAEALIPAQQNTKTYIGTAGDPRLVQPVQTLLFGAGHEIIKNQRARTAQTAGGTSALRVAAEGTARADGGVGGARQP